MKLKVLGSSSSGNCYILEGYFESLVVELGVHIDLIKKALRYNLKSVAGALVSHSHGDHAKSVQDAMSVGIKVYASDNTLSSYNHPYAIVIEPNKAFKIGGFTVLPLEVKHDVPCLSFVIHHKEMGSLLFVTDTMLFPYKVKGVNHLLIECNYDDKSLAEAIKRGVTFSGMQQRLLQSHMELQTTITTIKKQLEVSEGVREVILLHLSSNNSDRRKMVSEVEIATGVPTMVAESGLEVELL